MGEIGRPVAGDDLADQPDVFHSLLLKGVDIDVVGIGQGVVIHVEQGGGDEFGSDKPLVELAGLVELVDQLLGNHLTGLVMPGVHLKHFRLVDPVLHDLGGKLHKITGHIGPGQALVCTLRKQTMQAMPEFVEKGLHLVVAQQGGFVAHRL